MTRPTWQSTLRRTVVLLAIWFLVGPVLGILVVDRMNAFTVGGLPLGFWIAQQGAILVFVVLIFVNAWLAGRGAPATASALQREEPPGTRPADGVR